MKTALANRALSGDSESNVLPPLPVPDKAAMLSALAALFEPTDIVELRAFPKGRKQTSAGYFDGEHREDLVDAAIRLNRAGAVYLTMNRIDPQLLSRYCNRVAPHAQDTATDANVVRRRWLLIDLDPTRPKDTAATEAQVKVARDRAQQCFRLLKDQGWPDPLAGESGNGWHLLYPIDLPNNADSTALVKGVLSGLAAQLDDPSVKVDQAVFNAARITKFYGTVATKGDHTPAAPWRLSRLVSTPPRGDVVTPDQLRTLQPVAAPIPVRQPPERQSPQGEFRLNDFLSRHGIAYEEDRHEGRDRFKLAHCPFDEAHGRGEAAIFRASDGKLGFKCQHDSCKGRAWRDVRELFDGPRRENANPNSNRGERGERGEEPHQHSVSASPRAGEEGRILGEKQQKLLLEASSELIGSVRPQIPTYPIEALGEVLGEACLAIAEKGQVDPAMAGQSLLAAAALLCQSRADVRTLGGVKPISLYLLTNALSADGKSSADSAATRAIEQHQRERTREHKERVEEALAAPRKKGDPPPTVPRDPYLLMRDPTIEGVRRDFLNGQPSQGAFTAEGGAVLAGYGMSQDNRIKTGAGFNGLWDNGELSVSRALSGRLQLYDRRLSIHWLVQPDAARAALNDPVLSNIGFWPRFLVAWPEPLPPRRAELFRPEMDARIGRYWARCTELLQPLGEDCSRLPVIEFEPDAYSLAGRFFERMEVEAKTEGGSLTGVRAFALRATEHLFRVAGVLAVFDGRARVDNEHAARAARLVGYSLETWRSVFSDRDQAQAETDALRLYAWLLKQRGAQSSETAILRIGPKSLRSRSLRDSALAVLDQHGLACQQKMMWVALRRDV